MQSNQRMMEAVRRASSASLDVNASEVTSGYTASSPGPSAAARRWELHHDVEVTADAYWSPDVQHMEMVRKTRPWRHDVRYFKEVKLSALAALKMFIHAKRGGPDAATGRREWHEVMGLLLGHCIGSQLIITDSFGLPVDASEVECSMSERSQVYMADYLNYHRRVGKPDRGCVGWYHSHPGYTCFLSGIDVNTQQLNQPIQDPWLAIVVDPVRTISAGKLDIKAFRTFPEEYAAAHCGDGTAGVAASIPSDQVKEYGVHAHRYYELPITMVRSTADAALLDALLQQYWSLTFSTNSLLANRGFYTAQMERTVELLRAMRPSTHTSLTYKTARATDAGGNGGSDRQHRLYCQDRDPRRTPPAQAKSSSRANSERDDLIAARGGAERGSAAEEQLMQLTSGLSADVLLGGMQLSWKRLIFDGTSERH